METSLDGINQQKKQRMASENLYTPDCIRTVTGKYVNVFEPTLEMICIEDIAHALSMQPRFGGHLPIFYSVAQHSILTCMLVGEPHRLAALLHDASEAYLMDIPRPIKGKLTNYKEIEHGLMCLIAEKFGFQWPLHEVVKKADEQMLQDERHEMMLSDSVSYTWNPSDAKRNFLNKFNQLTTPAGSGE